MVMSAPFPEVTTYNVSAGLPTVLTYVNEVTGHWASNMILIAIYIIFAFGYYHAKRDWFAGIAVAGFGTFVVAIFFRMGGFIQTNTMAIIIAVMIIGFIGLFIPKEGY